MLEPAARASLHDVFRPPAGHSFDAGVLCTYSVALPALLSIPAALLMQASSDVADGLLPTDHPRLLASVRRTFGRLQVFCDESRIHVAQRLPSLVSDAERVIREVRAPGGGAFHPKICLLRFVPDEGDGPPLLRLSISSRNLTRDASWDAGAILEGRPGASRARKDALANMLRSLPEHCRTPLTPRRGRLVEEFARTAERVAWSSPAGLADPRVHVSGLGGRPWFPPSSDRLAVFAPFLDPAALGRLRSRTKRGVALLSRPEALDAIGPEGAGFDRLCVLGSPDDSGRCEHATGIAGLHAKVYVWDEGRRTRVALGSANATVPALTGGNVEAMVEFDCTALLKGGVRAMLDGSPLSAVLSDYQPADQAEGEVPEPDSRAARRGLASADLALRCEPREDGLVDASLVSRSTPPAVVASEYPNLRFWPVTVGSGTGAPCLEALASGAPAPCARPLALAEVTGFVSFGNEGSRVEAFTLNLPVEGLSEEERRAAVARAAIPNEASFLEFVSILLGDGRTWGAQDSSPGHAGGRDPSAAVSAGVLPAVLEALVRCAAHEPDRLEELETTIADLLRSAGGATVPARFQTLWTELRSGLRAVPRRARGKDC